MIKINIDITESIDRAVREEIENIFFDMPDEQKHKVIESAINKMFMHRDDLRREADLRRQVMDLIVEKFADQYVSQNFAALVGQVDLSTVSKMLHVQIASGLK